MVCSHTVPKHQSALRMSRINGKLVDDHQFHLRRCQSFILNVEIILYSQALFLSSKAENCVIKLSIFTHLLTFSGLSLVVVAITG